MTTSLDSRLSSIILISSLSLGDVGFASIPNSDEMLVALVCLTSGAGVIAGAGAMDC